MKQILIIMVMSSFLYSNNEVDDIVNSMLKEELIITDSSIKESFSNDKKITEKFNNLSVTNKYRVLNKVKEVNIKNFSKNMTEEDLQIKKVFDLLIKDLEEQEIFIGDIPDFELKLLVEEYSNKLKTNNLSTLSNSSTKSSCPLKNFTDSIYYKVKPAYTSYTSAFYYSNVITEPGEWPCDTELWYVNTKNNVYGTIYSVRALINIGYGGKLSMFTTPSRTHIVVGIKKYIWGLTDYALYRHTIIW